VKDFSLIPSEDSQQAVRIGRNLMVAGSSLLVILLMYFYYWQGFLPKRAFVLASCAILLLILFFYILFRSGANKKFQDPSLTVPQMLSAIVVTTYIIYQANDARGGFLLVYTMVFVFGLFRLTAREMLIIAAFVLSAYAFAISLLAVNKPHAVDAQEEMVNWLVLAVVLLWFAPIGGYIRNLRDRVRESNAELRAALTKIQDLVVHDELTGVHNRRYLTDILRKEKSRADRSGNTFCVAILDIDSFKNINDTFGHSVGDKVLKEFATVVENAVRISDYFGRFGGEEFLLLLTQTTVQTVPVFAERIRSLVEIHNWPGIPQELKITVSTGIAEYHLQEDVEDTLRRADAALYGAKHAGRNRVECSN
jgi:diguanylate cyclase (GGDEF)-like protein